MAVVSEGAVTFADDAAAIEYGRAEWAGVADSLPEDVADAVYDYTREVPGDSGITYREINGSLRGGPMSDEIAQHVSRIDEAMRAHPLTEDVVVTRGTGTAHWSVLPQDAAGTTFDESAYLSTSLGDAADAFSGQDAVLHLRVPEGTPALWVEAVSDFGATERELLLGRDLRWTAEDTVFRDGQWHVFGSVAK